jgi:hypothetical protein
MSPTHVLDCDPNETNSFSICPFVNSHYNQWSFCGKFLAFCERNLGFKNMVWNFFKILIS